MWCRSDVRATMSPTAMSPTEDTEVERAGSRRRASPTVNLTPHGGNLTPRGGNLTPRGGPKLDADAITDIIDHVMREADLDGAGRLSFFEFERLMHNIPDFEEKFSVNIQD